MSRHVFDSATHEHMEKIMSGKRHAGDIYKHIATGHKVYIHKCRDLSLVFRKGRKSVSDAIRDDVAELSIDIDLCKRMERLGCVLFGFHMLKSGDLYMIDLARFKTFRAMKNYSSTSGTYKYYTNMECFWFFGGNKDTLN